MKEQNDPFILAKPNGLAKIKGTPDVARKSFFELHTNILPYLKFLCTNPHRDSPKVFSICIQ